MQVMGTPSPVLVLNMKSSDTQFEDFLVPQSDKSLVCVHFLDFLDILLERLNPIAKDNGNHKEHNDGIKHLGYLSLVNLRPQHWVEVSQLIQEAKEHHKGKR